MTSVTSEHVTTGVIIMAPVMMVCAGVTRAGMGLSVHLMAVLMHVMDMASVSAKWTQPGPGHVSVVLAGLERIAQCSLRMFVMME